MKNDLIVQLIWKISLKRNVIIVKNYITVIVRYLRNNEFDNDFIENFKVYSIPKIRNNRPIVVDLFDRDSWSRKIGLSILTSTGGSLPHKWFGKLSLV